MQPDLLEKPIQSWLITQRPRHDTKLPTSSKQNITMKIPQILITPPDWLAVILCIVGASAYLGTLIVLKNLLH